MNAASALFGLFLIPIAGIAWEIFPGMIVYKAVQYRNLQPRHLDSHFFTRRPYQCGAGDIRSATQLQSANRQESVLVALRGQ